MNKRIVSRNVATNMKVVFFIVFIAYVQATSEPFDPKKVFDQNVHHCVEEHGLNKDYVVKILNQNTYPEDDKDFSIFYDCVADRLSMYEPNGDINFKHPYLEPFIRERLKLDDTVDVKTLIEKAVEHCAKSPKVEPRVVNAIRRRNCGAEHIAKHIH
ncbi:hypothetical protein RI129_002425 [Pyrocoelia pectoralis]|uniref:Uncharacterized protein n=1 Tax=Pyrocoelia pectoralis TaxID=417401 RepID=A0AAN7VML3_9COLE